MLDKDGRGRYNDALIELIYIRPAMAEILTTTRGNIMKYTCAIITCAALMLWTPQAGARTSDCQKKCTDAFIKCSGACASSADASCGAACFKERDLCTKNCAAEKAKPAPVDDGKKADTGKKTDAEKKVEPDADDDDADIDTEEDPDDDADIEIEEDIDDDADPIEEPEDFDSGPDDLDSPAIEEDDL